MQIKTLTGISYKQTHIYVNIINIYKFIIITFTYLYLNIHLYITFIYLYLNIAILCL